MCGRYTLTRPGEAMETMFGTRNRLNLPPRYNNAPSQDVPTVFRDPDFHDDEAGGGRHMGMMAWGFIPPWAKDATGPRPINARIESIAEKPLFRGNFRHRRCLLPADSFFEWKAEAGRKQPYLIRPKSRDLMAFAAIWSEWNPPGEVPTRTVAIVTTAADGPMRELHARMPVILEPDFHAAWLGEETAATPHLLDPPRLSGTQLEFFPVSPRVGNVVNDDPACLTPMDPDSAAKPAQPEPPKQGSLFQRLPGWG
jgi:putative SOS response-associated peptidase YedK